MDDSAHAVDATKMDVAMMEGEPEVMDEGVPSAPPVALSGEAKMGLKRVDDDTSTKPEDDDIKTVVEYEVGFSSQGVTDSGLVFGAAISIDEAGKGDAGSNGVNEASAYIGSADGTWKLQFGGNDPGIDLVGNIGVADADAISGMTKTVLPLFYTDEGDNQMKRVRLPSTVASAYEGQTYIATSLRGPLQTMFESNGALITSPEPELSISYVKQKDVDGAIKYDLLRTRSKGTALSGTVTGTNMPAPPPGGHTAMALTGTIASLSYALTASEAGEDTWSAGVKYDAGTFYVSAGVDYNDVLTVGSGGTFAGNTVKATYVKQSGETYNVYLTSAADLLGYHGPTWGKAQKVNEMEAYGVSFSRAIGSGTNVTLAYSRLTDKGLKPTFVGTKQWELDFTYDLGGGASFYAGIEQANKSKFTGTYKAVSGTTAASISTQRYVTYTPIATKSKVTTLEAGITMSF